MLFEPGTFASPLQGEVKGVMEMDSLIKYLWVFAVRPGIPCRH